MCLLFCLLVFVVFFFVKQSTAYEMRSSDWSSDVCSSDLPAEQRAILFEMVAELLVRRRADAADHAARQRGLEQVRRIHRAARGCTGTDDGVDLVDEQARVRQTSELGHDLFQPLLEITPVPGTGEPRYPI